MIKPVYDPLLDIFRAQDASDEAGKLKYDPILEAFRMADTGDGFNLDPVSLQLRHGALLNQIPDGNPSALVAVTISDVRIDLTWTIGSTDHEGHRIYISTDNVDFTEKGTVTAETASYQATGLTEGTLYYFKVVAYKGNGESAATEDSNTTIYGRNDDVVEVAGYANIIISGGSSWSFPAAGRYLLLKNNRNKIRQAGNITKVKFYIENRISATTLFFQVWRKVGTKYNLIGEEDIRSKITTNGIVEITLTTPIAALEGDYIGVGGTGDGNTIFRSYASSAGSSIFYTSSVARPVGDQYDWDSKSNGGALILPVKAYGQAPLITCIGDSIIAGHPDHYNYIEDSIVDSLATSMPYQLSQLNALYITQNMGIGGQTTTAISERFAADLVAQKPRYAVIEGGVNDAYNGPVSVETYTANLTTMLDACVAAGVIPICCKIFPDSNSSTAQARLIDDYMEALVALLVSYPTAKFVNFDSMGQFRSGGDLGNLWDLKTMYSNGGTHMNQAGHGEVARLLDIAIRSI